MVDTIYVLDKVLDEISTEIAAHPPERGGALMGFIGKPVITCFIFDKGAETTTSTYRPSRGLNQIVKEVEISQKVELKGIIHSHPGTFDRPSSQDEYELGIGLNINRHMPCYLAPIVTMGMIGSSLNFHEVKLQNGKISFYAACRSKSSKGFWNSSIDYVTGRSRSEIILKALHIKVIPLYEDMLRLHNAFKKSSMPEILTTRLENNDYFTSTIYLDQGLELMVLADEHYPDKTPTVLLTMQGGDTVQLSIPKTNLLNGQNTMDMVVRACQAHPLTSNKLQINNKHLNYRFIGRQSQPSKVLLTNADREQMNAGRLTQSQNDIRNRQIHMAKNPSNKETSNGISQYPVKPSTGKEVLKENTSLSSIDERRNNPYLSDNYVQPKCPVCRNLRLYGQLNCQECGWEYANEKLQQGTNTEYGKLLWEARSRYLQRNK